MPFDDDDLWSKVTKNIPPIHQKKINLESTIAHSKKEFLEKIRSRHMNERPMSYNTDKFSVTVESQKYFESKKIQKRLDLHGKTCQEAEKILDLFFYQSQLNNIKTVLIITGKGVPKECNSIQNPGPYGVLRLSVCQWFQNNANFVVCYSEAKTEHGGKGAFYVHVRGYR